MANYYHNIADQSEARVPPLAESYVAITRYDYLTSSIPITRLHYGFLQSMQQTQSVDVSLGQVANRLGIPKENVHRSWKNEIRNCWMANHFFVDRKTLGKEETRNISVTPSS